MILLGQVLPPVAHAGHV